MCITTTCPSFKPDTQGEKSDKELSVSEPKEVSNGEVAAAADSVSNGNVEVAATADSVSNCDSTQDKKDNGVSEPANGEKDPEAATSSDEPINTAAETDGHEIAEKNPKADAPSENPNDSSAVVESVNTTVHPTVSEKDAHLPTEPAEGFPDGWVIRRIPRLNPTDKRTDRNWYSPKLGLKFRAKADAMRFLAKLESAKGDEAAAIMEFYGKKKTNKVANKAANRKTASKVSSGDGEVGGTKTEYDFSEDTPLGPDLIRRCLAVIRTLCASSSTDQFVYPVDPQLYPG